MEPYVEEAGLNSIDAIADCHAHMFEEMLRIQQQTLSEETAQQIVASMRLKLLRELPDNICKFYLVREHARIVAVGGLTITSSVPSPYDTTNTIGYIHTMYTYPDHRNKGYASALIKKIIDYSQKSGLKRLTLNASQSAVDIYEKIGFSKVQEHMRLYI